MTRRARFCWVVLALPLLVACAGTLLPKAAPPPARFTLDAGLPLQAPAAAGASAPVLTVDLPRAAPGHEGRRMVYLRRPQELQAFAFHEWVEPPARMLAPMLVRALQNRADFRVVLLAPSAAAGGWRLETEGLQLQQDFTVQPSQLRLGLRAVLVDAGTRQALAWREFELSVAAAGEDPVAGAAAAQEAARQLAAAVAAFCGEQALRLRAAR